MPPGPWLLVVGMHRSGTSAVTGALGHLGFAVPAPDDRWEPSDENPDHFESRALANYDDVLLEKLGGTWDRPPEPDLDWESADLGDPSGPASEAFPSPGPVVWKDPRSCLLLPYWLGQLPKPVAAVFIWRSPIAVARSLQSRDRLPLADGVALWERYNRSGLAGLIGVDTFVTRYESIVEDPAGKLGALASWLGELPQFATHAPHWDLAAAAASISPQLRRQQASGEADLLLDEHRRLTARLEDLEGPHRPLQSALTGSASPWAAALLADRHQLAVLSGQRDTYRETARLRQWEIQGLVAQVGGLNDHVNGLKDHVEQLKDHVEQLQDYVELLKDELERSRTELAELHEAYEAMQTSTSWRVTRPLRQVATLKSRNVTTPGD